LFVDDAYDMQKSELKISGVYGDIYRVLCQTSRKNLRLYSVEAQITPPIRLNQYRILYNSRNVPLAYATWAFISDDMLNALKTNPDRLLHISEWNEGKNLWIMDFVAIKKRALPLWRVLRKELGQTHNTFHSARRDEIGNFVRYVEINTHYLSKN
jgi:cytolysin-activating lysine-acyltransferase